MNTMKTPVLIAAFAACIAIASAQSDSKPADFIKKVGEVSGGAVGLNMGASKEEHEKQLAALQALVGTAPDQSGRDAANANICVLLALTGKPDEAAKVLDEIQDPQTKAKRKLQVTKIVKGQDAALEELKALLAQPGMPADEQVIYVEKLVSTIGKDEPMSEELVAIVTDSMGSAKFDDKNARLGLMLVKYQQRALKAKAGDKEKLRAVLAAVIAQTSETEKTRPFLEAARESVKKIEGH